MEVKVKLPLCLNMYCEDVRGVELISMHSLPQYYSFECLSDFELEVLYIYVSLLSNTCFTFKVLILQARDL
jgi:hypothetical protein